MSSKAEQNLFENVSSKLSFWDIGFPKSQLELDDDSDDDSEELDVLSELVRNQYMKRLHQTLLDNLDVAKGYQKHHLNKIDQCVDVCMVEMEKQALRQCMVTRIYREAMTKMINKVKTCTNNSMLYVFLKHLIESNNQASYTYNVKSENMKTNTVSVGVNTKLQLNKEASTQTKNFMDPDESLPINSYANHVNVNNVNKSKLPFSSCDVKSEISELCVFKNSSSLLKSLSCSSSAYEDLPTEINNKYNLNPLSNLQNHSEKGKNDQISINALLRDLQDSSEDEQLQPSTKLEERLLTLGLANGIHSPPENCIESPKSNFLSPNTIRPTKIREILTDKFKSERVAKTYEFKKSINSLPQEQQTRLNHRFKDLFGEDHAYEPDPLSIEEERIIAHKRVVKMVVEYMTPYYKAQRITRHLFKTLAKLISKNLMDRSYDPDTKTVARGVDEFFSENRCIKTMEDIYR